MISVLRLKIFIYILVGFRGCCYYSLNTYRIRHSKNKGRGKVLIKTLNKFNLFSEIEWYWSTLFNFFQFKLFKAIIYPLNARMLLFSFKQSVTYTRKYQLLLQILVLVRGTYKDYLQSGQKLVVRWVGPAPWLWNLHFLVIIFTKSPGKSRSN